MITLNDLIHFEGKYYVGNLIDMDGINWVNEEEALKILEEINQ